MRTRIALSVAFLSIVAAAPAEAGMLNVRGTGVGSFVTSNSGYTGSGAFTFGGAYSIGSYATGSHYAKMCATSDPAQCSSTKNDFGLPLGPLERRFCEQQYEALHATWCAASGTSVSVAHEAFVDAAVGAEGHAQRDESRQGGHGHGEQPVHAQRVLRRLVAQPGDGRALHHHAPEVLGCEGLRSIRATRSSHPSDSPKSRPRPVRNPRSASRLACSSSSIPSADSSRPRSAPSWAMVRTTTVSSRRRARPCTKDASMRIPAAG